MKNLSLITALVFALLASVAFCEDRRGDNPVARPLSAEEQLRRFKVPPGFEVQLVATEPEIQKPINLNFDAAGRLWVTSSELYPWPAATDALGQPLPDFQKTYDEIATAFGSKGKAPAIVSEGRDTVRILSDFAPNGRAQKFAIFADKLNIPTGIQPLPRELGAKGDTAIVYSIPNIWRFEDTDGDGKADKREPLYEGFGYLDTFGMSSNYIYWIDGWIYGCHGFRNHSEVKDRTGKVTVFDSGNTYRFKPDGSKIECFTHGQTNPFGLAFDPEGNLYSADLHSGPISLLLRGGYYEGIGKQHDGLGFAPRITDDDHRSSSSAGIMYYADDKWPLEFFGNLFNGNPVTQRINRSKLEWNGSTPKATRVEDFVTCDDPWFRPVQTKLGPDGALYIADFYNPVFGHDEVPLNDPRRDHTHGRIWRVVWRGEKGEVPIAMAPNLRKLDVQGLVETLGDTNLEVRRLATNELVDVHGRTGLKKWRERPAVETSVVQEEPTPGASVIPSVTALPGAGAGYLQADFHTAFFNAPSHQRKYLLWVLDRVGEVTANVFQNAAGISATRGTPNLQGDRETRTDALRLATEQVGSDVYEEYTVHRWLVQAVLEEMFRERSDSDYDDDEHITPLMQRLAAEAMPRFLERRPRRNMFAPDEFASLMEIAAKGGNDPAFQYTARMAIRDVLIRSGELQDRADLITQLPQDKPGLQDFAEQIADVSIAVPTTDAAQFLIQHINRYGLSR
ncbi:DUF7133 domain-containing protein [Verrucomicrobiota bacterium sgz303538]